MPGLLNDPDSQGGPRAFPDPTETTGRGAAGPSQVTGIPRRQFLHAVGGEAASTATIAAGAVAGAQAGLLAEARALAAAAGIGLSDEMIAVEGPVAAPGAAGPVDPESAAASAAAATAGISSLPYRSPYRVEPGAVIVVDQRRLPGALVEVPCLHAGDAAAAIRDGLAQGPGTIAAVAAYGLARGAAARAAAFGAANATDPRPLDALYSDANLLFSAAPWVVPLKRALDRLVARAEAAGPSTPPLAVAEQLQAEADALVMEQLAATSALVGEGADLLRTAAARRLRESTRPRDPREPLRILVHGPVGALSFGQLGTVVGAVQAAAAAGVPLYVWVAEGRPPLSGVRTAWELSLAGIGHGLVPDSAVGGLLASSVDIVLTGALGVTASGDVVDDPGAYAIAALAARHDVPVYACVLGSMLFSAEAGPSARFDVTPADLVSGFVTDAGVVPPPFGPALTELADVPGTGPAVAGDLGVDR